MKVSRLQLRLAVIKKPKVLTLNDVPELEKGNRVERRIADRLKNSKRTATHRHFKAGK